MKIQSTPFIASGNHKFHYQFLPVWRLQTTITTVLIFALTLGAFVMTGKPVQKPDILLSLSVSALAGVFWAIVIAAVRFEVSDAGFRTFNTWGRWKWVSWEAVALAGPGRYYFLPHLRISVDGASWSFWIPLFLADMAAYRNAVIACAGPDNLISRALPVPPSVATRLVAPAAHNVPVE